ncbi:MAG TPA: hypothetical protein DCY93_00260 [Firmicutes bacterium]|nr:hypothetical protein [Bacillota bacterium]
MMNNILYDTQPDPFMIIGIIFPFFMFILIAIISIVTTRKKAKLKNNNHSSEIRRSLNQKYNNLMQKKSKHKCEFNAERVREMNKICPNCHSTIKSHERTCPVCGSSLKNVCPVCGLINHEKSILCQECHSKLPSARKKHKYRDSQIKHGKGEDYWMEF